MARESKDKPAESPAADDRDEQIRSLQSDLSEAKMRVEQALSKLRSTERVRDDALAEIALMRESGATPVSDRERVVVRVRSRAENPAGMCLYGHQVTRKGFDLDVTDFDEKRLDDLANDPNLEVI